MLEKSFQFCNVRSISEVKHFKEKDTEKMYMGGKDQSDTRGHLDDNTRITWKPKSACTIGGQWDIGKEVVIVSLS